MGVDAFCSILGICNVLGGLLNASSEVCPPLSSAIVESGYGWLIRVPRQESLSRQSVGRYDLVVQNERGKH